MLLLLLLLLVLLNELLLERRRRKCHVLRRRRRLCCCCRPRELSRDGRQPGHKVVVVQGVEEEVVEVGTGTATGRRRHLRLPLLLPVFLFLFQSRENAQLSRGGTHPAGHVRNKEIREGGRVTGAPPKQREKKEK